MSYEGFQLKSIIKHLFAFNWEKNDPHGQCTIFWNNQKFSTWSNKLTPHLNWAWSLLLHSCSKSVQLDIKIFLENISKNKFGLDKDYHHMLWLRFLANLTKNTEMEIRYYVICGNQDESLAICVFVTQTIIIA